MKTSALRSLVDEVLQEANLERFDPDIVDQLILIGKSHEADILQRAAQLAG